MKALTKRQKEVLEFCIDKVEADNRFPTLYDIRDKFGFSSHNASSDHCRALERKGFLENTASGYKLSRNKFKISVTRHSARPPEVA